ncbi:MAG: hypothetical protein R3263_02890, partial [Myxococcota bacterium]|nr:hypothetical protein [Myxococcota bacterium]
MTWWNPSTRRLALAALLALTGCATAPPEPAPEPAPGDGAGEPAPVDPALQASFQRGLDRLRAEDFAAAVTIFRDIIAQNDALPGAHANLGIA